jgi:hypothetical protein
MFAASSFLVRAATLAPSSMRVAATVLGLCMSVFGVLLQGRGLRDGRSIIIIAWTNAVATMVAMIAGHVILLEAMPFLTIHKILRLIAICLILAGIAASALRYEPPLALVSAVILPPMSTPLARFTRRRSRATSGTFFKRRSFVHHGCS